MKRLLRLLCVILAIPVSSASAYSERPLWEVQRENLTAIFWNNLHYQGETTDFFQPPPNYDQETDTLLQDREIYGYKDEWLYFWQEEDAILEWAGIEFCAGEKAPNWDEWGRWYDNNVDLWSDYFAEQYYVGGENNVLASKDYEAFWSGLTLEGKGIDPFQEPPNYDADLDVWKNERARIGYHWYWQYYFRSVTTPILDNPEQLCWNGIAFDANRKPDNYDGDTDILFLSRFKYTYLEYWAACFLGKELPDPLIAF